MARARPTACGKKGHSAHWHTPCLIPCPCVRAGEPYFNICSSWWLTVCISKKKQGPQPSALSPSPWRCRAPACYQHPRGWRRGPASPPLAPLGCKMRRARLQVMGRCDVTPAQVMGRCDVTPAWVMGRCDCDSRVLGERLASGYDVGSRHCLDMNTDCFFLVVECRYSPAGKAWLLNPRRNVVEEWSTAQLPYRRRDPGLAPESSHKGAGRRRRRQVERTAPMAGCQVMATMPRVPAHLRGGHIYCRRQCH